MEIKLTYNPYSLVVTASKKTKSRLERFPDGTEWLKKIQNTPLQGWFRKGDNWQGLCSELAKNLNEETITIHFEGRKYDYDDLKDLCDEYNRSTDCHCRFIVKKPQRYILSDSGIMKQLDQIKRDLEAGAIEGEQIKNAVEAYRECKKSEFEIAVVATMSSGKSTLINALLHQKLLPVANEATTAKIFRIFDKDESEQFTFLCRDSKEQALMQKPAPATLEEMNTCNGREDVFYIDLYGNIPGISGGNLKLKLMDTPGPNNSTTTAHRAVTNSVIHDKEHQPVILFVLDATKLRDESEANLLRDIANVMKESKQAQQRFIFVINKADELDAENNENISDIMARTQKYLEENLNLSASQIIPVSARTALLESIKQSEGLSSIQQRKLETGQEILSTVECDLVSAAVLSPECRKKLNDAKVKAEADGDEATLTSILSGIYGLELAINEYLEKYARPYKIYRCMDAMLRQLKDLNTDLNFEKCISENQMALQQAKDVLAEIEQKIFVLNERGDEIKKKSSEIGGREKFSEIIQELWDELSSEMLNHFGNLEKYGSEIPACEEEEIYKNLDDKLAEQSKIMKSALLTQLNEKMQEDFSPLYQLCSGVLSDFKQELTQLPGLDTQNVFSLHTLNEALIQLEQSSLEQYLHKNPISSFEKTRLEVKEYNNPDREGFFGFFKFWQPKKLRRQIEISDGKFISFDSLTSAVTTYINSLNETSTKEILNNMDGIYREQKSRVLALVAELQATIKNEADKRTEQIGRAKAFQINLLDLEKRKKTLNLWIQQLCHLGI